MGQSIVDNVTVAPRSAERTEFKAGVRRESQKCGGSFVGWFGD